MKKTKHKVCDKNNYLLIWFLQIRGPFLILSAALVFLGFSIAVHDGFIHWIHALMLLIGVIQAHIAVNLFNELSDYQTGIDSGTTQTPFSGGSKMMQTNLTHPRSVRKLAYINLFSAGLIGAYFCFTSNISIIFLMILGGLAIRFYTSHFAKWMVGEIISGLTLGSCVVIGVYLALTGTLDWHVALLSLPPGILTTQLLFLNEFPDSDADHAGGRRHWVIQWGRARSAVFYCLLMALCFLIIGIIPGISRFPSTLWLGLGPLPLTVITCRGTVKFHSNTQKLIPILAINVLIILLTDTLLGVGLLIG